MFWFVDTVGTLKKIFICNGKQLRRMPDGFIEAVKKPLQYFIEPKTILNKVSSVCTLEANVYNGESLCL